MAHKTILLKGDPLIKEAKANEAGIYPGMLIEYVTNDETVRKHATAGGNAACMVALEDSLQGKEVGTVYTSGTRVRYAHLRPGDEFMAFLGESETVALGTLLESKGNGTFAAFEKDSSTATAEEASVVAMALEAVTGSSASEGLIKAVCVR
jgi:hypothetical protein